jgi:hypothetical protein
MKSSLDEMEIDNHLNSSAYKPPALSGRKDVVTYNLKDMSSTSKAQ